MTVGPDSVLVPHPSVHAVALDDEKVLFLPESGTLQRLDPIATLVWDCLAPPAPLSTIVADLAEVFGSDSRTVGADVMELVRELHGSGALVDGVGDVAPDA